MKASACSQGLTIPSPASSLARPRRDGERREDRDFVGQRARTGKLPAPWSSSEMLWRTPRKRAERRMRASQRSLVCTPAQSGLPSAAASRAAACSRPAPRRSPCRAVSHSSRGRCRRWRTRHRRARPPAPATRAAAAARRSAGNRARDLPRRRAPRSHGRGSDTCSCPSGSGSPEATRSCHSTRSSPVIASVTVCSTCSRVFISMK